jgi:hypothetical protein
MESMPRVLNYKRDGLPPGAVYIGRMMPQYGLVGSKWHNPYKVGRDGTREEVIAKYERHLHDSGLIDAVRELRGRDLVCWCAPEPCHGDVLLRLANAVGSLLPLTNCPPGAAAPPAPGS